MPKFAANLTLMFTEVDFPKLFEAAAKAGFAGVEFLFPYDHAPEAVAGWLSGNGLRSVLFNMPPGDWAAGDRGIASLPGRERQFRDGVDLALRYAEALGTPCIHAMAGRVPAGADRARHRVVFVDNLRYAAAELGKAGRTLLIEPINTRDFPGYFLDTQAEAHAVREEVGAPNLKVQMDFYHAQIAEGDISTTLRRHLEHIGHF